MKTFLVSYDLKDPEFRRDYENLFSYIKSFQYWAKPLYSVWLVKSSKTAGEIRNDIKNIIDSNDKVLVIEVSKHWGTYGVSSAVTDWMKVRIN